MLDGNKRSMASGMLLAVISVAWSATTLFADVDEASMARPFVHPRAVIQGSPEPFRADFKTKGVLTAEDAVNRAVGIMRKRGIARLCICEVSWIAAPVSGYLVDAQGDLSLDGGRCSLFRLGITDSPQGSGSLEFPEGAGEEFVFIARGVDAAGRTLWFPPPGPDCRPGPQQETTMGMLAYEYLLGRQRFETLPERYPPCPPTPREVLTSELLEACRRGDVKRARLAAEEGADIDVQDEAGQRPLLWAVEYREATLARLLVEKGADVNAATRGGGKTVSGYTPLMAACHWGDRGTILLLLEHGARTDVLDENGSSPLWIGLEDSHFAILDLLLQHRADIDLKDHDGRTPLMRCIAREEYKNLQWLLRHGAALDARDKEGKTALMLAAAGGKAEAVRLLMEAGAALEARDTKGWTALAAAVFAGQKEMAEYLISSGKASARVADPEGTPLVVEAARRLDDDHADLIKMLAEKGASANDRDKQGNTPLSEAAQRMNWEVVRVLIGLGADLNDCPAEQPPVITQAYWDKQFDLVKWLLNKGADPGKRFKDRDPFWIWPFADGNKELIYRALARVSSLDLRDERQATPLMWACRLGWSDVAAWLLDRGAGANLDSQYGKTALMEAAEKGHLEVVDLLLKYKGDVQARTGKGWTPLMWAAEKGHDAVVKKLLAAGADPRAVNGKGQSALDIARLNRQASTARLLDAASRK